MKVPERILQQVVVMEDGCHEWIGTTGANGYGKAKIDGKNWKIHRFFYAAAGNWLPDYVPGGMQIDHLCLNKVCCNVCHLELVTQSENARRRGANQTHCLIGHKYTDINTGHNRGGRYCKECNNRKCREYRLKKRGN